MKTEWIFVFRIFSGFRRFRGRCKCRNQMPLLAPFVHAGGVWSRGPLWSCKGSRSRRAKNAQIERGDFFIRANPLRLARTLVLIIIVVVVAFVVVVVVVVVCVFIVVVVVPVAVDVVIRCRFSPVDHDQCSTCPSCRQLSSEFSTTLNHDIRVTRANRPQVSLITNRQQNNRPHASNHQQCNHLEKSQRRYD